MKSIKRETEEKGVKKQIKSNKGITLIALVITIIVLLILAGVTIAMLSGENGILSRATETRATNADAQADEQAKLAYMGVRTEIIAERVSNTSYNAKDNTGKLAARVRNSNNNIQQYITAYSSKLSTATGGKITARVARRNEIGAKGVTNSMRNPTPSTGYWIGSAHYGYGNPCSVTDNGGINNGGYGGGGCGVRPLIVINIS